MLGTCIFVDKRSSWNFTMTVDVMVVMEVCLTIPGNHYCSLCKLLQLLNFHALVNMIIFKKGLFTCNMSCVQLWWRCLCLQRRIYRANMHDIWSFLFKIYPSSSFQLSRLSCTMVLNLCTTLHYIHKVLHSIYHMLCTQSQKPSLFTPKYLKFLSLGAKLVWII